MVSDSCECSDCMCIVVERGDKLSHLRTRTAPWFLVVDVLHEIGCWNVM